jgi:ParB family chromosome partitioning protein
MAKLDKEILKAEIFGGQKSRLAVVAEGVQVIEGVKLLKIKLDEINDHHKHTFSVVKDEEYYALVASFQSNDMVIEPITVRISDKYGKPYECIAGHRRRMAAREAGREEIWAFVVDMDDDEADIWMVDSNLSTRKVRFFEEVRSLRVKYDAMKRQGKKGGGRTDAALAAEQGMSRGYVQDLLKLSGLVDGLLITCENKQITKEVGKVFAEMPKSKQADLLTWIIAPTENKPVNIKPEQAEEIVSLSKSDNWNKTNVTDVFDCSKNAIKPPSFRLTEKDIVGWFPPSYIGTTKDKIALIEELVKQHFDQGCN